MLSISHFEKDTELLGPGHRSVIWMYGCCFDCEGCMAINTRFGKHYELTVDQLAEMVTAADTNGITISGGEPFLQTYELCRLLNTVRSKRDIGVIIYTGFLFEDILRDEDKRQLLSLADIIIDGQYIKDLDDGRAYVGSSNQRIIYLTERYREIGREYYSRTERRAEIKITDNEATIIGIPGSETLKLWKRIKNEYGEV